MSYNKLKSLVANVEAIKTALQIHIQGRQATPEEKETLSQYSGFGGIKEVLNIGTDKPVSGDMEEPIRDRKSTRLNSSHIEESRMPSSA